MISLLAFALVSAALLLGVIFLNILAGDARRPFPSHEKLLREAGHSLRVKLAELDRGLARRLLVCVAIGVSPLLNLVRDSGPGDRDPTDTALARIAFGILVVVVAFSVYSMAGYARRRRNLALGLLGERIVAEHLEPLKASGHRVFHDVPAGAPPAGSTIAPYDIDHVVVGPAGVFAIETKTRRKGRARVGFMAHEIIYDGRALAYPWGEDQHGLGQARRQAEWLAEFLQGQLGRPVPVQALLVFPGWSIIRKADGSPAHAVNVLAPKELPAAIERPSPSGHAGVAVPALDAATIDLVARRLEARCRDVEL